MYCDTPVMSAQFEVHCCEQFACVRTKAPYCCQIITNTATAITMDPIRLPTMTFLLHQSGNAHSAPTIKGMITAKITQFATGSFSSDIRAHKVYHNRTSCQLRRELLFNVSILRFRDFSSSSWFYNLTYATVQYLRNILKHLWNVQRVELLHSPLNLTHAGQASKDAE